MTHLSRANASLLAGLAFFVLTPQASADSPDALPALGLSKDRLATIGVSSGGYMAAQLAVAWPERFDALGLVAAGPWGCARGELGVALGQCMFTRLGDPDLAAIDSRLADYRELDRAGSAESLDDLKVYLWHGEDDGTIDPDVGHAAARQWRDWLADDDQLKTVFQDGAGHGWPALDAAGEADLADCEEGGAPFLLDCGLDLAGEALVWWWDDLAPAGEADDQRLLAFDQSEFDAKGLADTGFVYLPKQCESGDCALVVALHGCQMGVDDDEGAATPFTRASGLNRYAESNDLVVLYPQAEASLANPKGCWDWWGFSESTWQRDPLHDSRDGRQVSALMQMVDRLQEAP